MSLFSVRVMVTDFSITPWQERKVNIHEHLVPIARLFLADYPFTKTEVEEKRVRLQAANDVLTKSRQIEEFSAALAVASGADDIAKANADLAFVLELPFNQFGIRPDPTPTDVAAATPTNAQLVTARLSLMENKAFFEIGLGDGGISLAHQWEWYIKVLEEEALKTDQELSDEQVERDRKECPKVGDIIDIMPDGHPWSEAELNPSHFMLITVDAPSYEEMAHLVAIEQEPVFNTTSQDIDERVVRFRAWGLPAGAVKPGQQLTLDELTALIVRRK